MTQTDRTLAALHAHRERGINSVDFLRFPTIDGGPPITRLAARVEELRSKGFQITSGERRDKCIVYRIETDLAGLDEGLPHPDHETPSETPRLFDVMPRSPSLAEEAA